MAEINGFIDEYWWAMLALALVINIGAIAVMAVLGDPSRPTVRTAVSRGAAKLLPQFASQILTNMSTSLVLIAALLIGMLSGSQSVAATLSVFSVPVSLWLVTRLSLSGAVLATERTSNPLTALVRSWRLTEANNFRLVAFYLLIFVAFFVVWQVVGLLAGLLTALAGAQLAHVLEAMIMALILAITVLLAYAVAASVHRQLARAERVSVPSTHEA